MVLGHHAVLTLLRCWSDGDQHGEAAENEEATCVGFHGSTLTAAMETRAGCHTRRSSIIMAQASTMMSCMPKGRMT